MTFARVAGTVVLTRRADTVPGARFLLVEACTPRLEGRGEYLVAVDTVGAGEGELVMVAQGPSARNTAADRPPVGGRGDLRHRGPGGPGRRSGVPQVRAA